MSHSVELSKYQGKPLNLGGVIKLIIDELFDEDNIPEVTFTLQINNNIMYICSCPLLATQFNLVYSWRATHSNLVARASAGMHSTPTSGTRTSRRWESLLSGREA